MRTWKITVNGRELQVKALKTDVKSLNNAFHRLTNINQYHRELSGIKGTDNERSSVLWVMFGKGAPLLDQEKFDQEFNTLLNKWPAICATDIPVIKTRISEIFNEHVPIVDNRKTQEQATNDTIERKEVMKKHDIERTHQEQEIGLLSGERVDLPEGKRFVTIEAYFNDSHMMTDYYHPHSSLSHTYALAIIKSGNRSEAPLRRVLEQIPELNKFEWTWNKQNYSMGHGNWLQSPVIGKIKHKAYDGREKVAYWYEIRFEGYSKNMEKSKYFVDLKPVTYSQAETVEDVTITENEEKDGVEIRFSGKPDEDVRSNLKSNGFRWSRFSKCWYRKRSETSLAFANSFVN